MARQQPLFDDLYEKCPPRATGLRAWLNRFFFGDDIFISYSRSDAGKYVTALAAGLSGQGYLCYFDQLGTDVNRNLPNSLKAKIGKSTALVLIGTEGAAASRYVREEVELFKETKRPIIPIDVDGALQERDWPELTGLSRIPESRKRIEKGELDQATLKLLRDSANYRRRNQWLRLSLIVGFSFIALTVIISAGLSTFLVTDAKAQTATAQLTEAAAKVMEGRANEAAETAKTNELHARAQADSARVQTAEANKNTTAALKQQELAETGRRHALELELEAKERAAAAMRQEQGTQATLLSRVPGREFDALEIALATASAEFRRAHPPASQVIEGLVASVTATNDEIPIRKTFGDVTYAQISSNARMIFVETDHRLTGVVRWGLWDARTGEPLTLTPLREHRYTPSAQFGFFSSQRLVRSASFSGDGHRVAVIDEADHLQIWDLKGEITSLRDNFEPVERAVMDNDGKRLATYQIHRVAVVKITNLDTGAEKLVENPFGVNIEFMAFDQHGELLLVGNSEYRPNFRLTRKIYATATKTFTDLGENWDRILGLSNLDLPIYFFDPSTQPLSEQKAFRFGESQRFYLKEDGFITRAFSGCEGKVSSVAVIDNSALAVTIKGGQGRVCGAHAYADFATWRGHASQIGITAFSKDDTLAVTLSGDNMLLLWSAPTGQLLRSLSLSASTVRLSAFAFSADNKRLGAMSGGFPEVWDLASGKNLTSALPGCGNYVSTLDGTNPFDYSRRPKAIAFLPDNQRLVTLHLGGVIARWDMNKCEPETFTLGVHAELVALSPDGTAALAIVGQDRLVKVWDLSGLSRAGGLPVEKTLANIEKLPPGTIAAAIVHADNFQVLLLKGDSSAEIWQVGRKATLKLQGAESDIFAAAFSLDGTTLAVLNKEGFRSGPIVVWNTRTGEKLISIPGDFELTQTALTLSRDGSHLMAGLKDNTVRIYPTTKSGFFEVASRKLVR